MVCMVKNIVMTSDAYFKIKKFILNNPDIDYGMLIKSDFKKMGALKCQ